MLQKVLMLLFKICSSLDDYFAGANPLWNPDDGFQEKTTSYIIGINEKQHHPELDSDSSGGDDEFIGVEDQEDFKGYKDRYDDDDTTSMESSISGTPPFILYREGIVKGNPLFDESTL